MAKIRGYSGGAPLAIGAAPDQVTRHDAWPEASTLVQGHSREVAQSASSAQNLSEVLVVLYHQYRFLEERIERIIEDIAGIAANKDRKRS